MAHPLSAIKRLELASKNIAGAISLAQGVPSLESHWAAREGAVKAIQEGKADAYSSPRGLEELRSAMSESLRKQGFIFDSAKEIIVTAGSIEGLSCVLLSILNAGDEVIVFTPTYYENYRSIVEMAKGVIVASPLEETRAWKVDFNDLEKRINRRTKAFIICSPNNPTGSMIPAQDMECLALLTKQHGLYLICDEVYRNLYYGSEVPFSFPHNGQDDRIIHIVSFSKDFALSGWRVGCIYAPEYIIENILSVHDSLVNCAPVVSQHATIGALQHEQEIVDFARQEYGERKKLMEDRLLCMEDFLRFVSPQGAYYIFPRLYGMQDSERFAFELLSQAGLAVVPGSSFGEGGEGHIRLCFGRSRSDIEKGMDRLEAFLHDRLKKSSRG